MIGAALQKAVYATLMAEPALAGGNVFDRVPKKTDAFPRITIGDEQIIDDSNSCAGSWDVAVDVHVWSRPRSGSKAEVKDIAAAAARRLATEIPVIGFVTTEGRLEGIRTFRDQDGLTEHSVVTLRYLIDEA